MTQYTKPHNVRYVDMCIYIDEHIYNDDYDEDLVFKYLFLLIKMFARKGHIFQDTQHYEDFALWAASNVFMRLIDPRQSTPEGSKHHLKKIKGIRNYLEFQIPNMRVDFEQSEYYQDVIHTSRINIENEDVHFFRNILMHNSRLMNECEARIYIDQVPHTLKCMLKELPYKDKVTFHRLYTSCLLTLCSSITLTTHQIKQLQSKVSSSDIYFKWVESVYQHSRKNGTILFHLDNSYEQIVSYIVDKLKHMIYVDCVDTLTQLSYSNVYIDDLIEEKDEVKD